MKENLNGESGEGCKLESGITFNQNRCEVLINVSSDKTGVHLVEVFAVEHNLLPKNEFHVTLVGGKTSLKIVEILGKLSEEEREEKIKQITDLAENVDRQIIFMNKFYYLNRQYNDPDPNDPAKTIPEVRETIIQLVDVPQLREFYDKLKDLLGLTEPIESLPHVTIYSNSTREDKKQRGIGIYSNEDLAISNAQEIKLD